MNWKQEGIIRAYGGFLPIRPNVIDYYLNIVNRNDNVSIQFD